MFNHTFYHSTTQKYVIMFGSLFDDIIIRRFSNAGGELQSIKVPIRYGPKMKWVSLADKHPSDMPALAVQLPRITFEVMNMTRDMSRKINNVHKLVTIVDSEEKMLTQFAPSAYKVNFELSVLAKNTSDALQIIEQIIPFFQPDFTPTLDLIPGSRYKYDIRVNMADGLSKQDVYDGDFTDRRILVWTLNFEIDAWYFGPIAKNGVIKRVQIDLHNLGGSGVITHEEETRSGRTARIVVQPGLTASGEPTSDINQSIPYKQILATDDYGYIEETYEFSDGLHYDPVSGRDK